jgi:long-chain fatty acid transport protein
MRSRRRLALVAVSLAALPAAPAEGAGFAIFEEGARGMGFAGAFTAQASDPSAIFHNAAGIAFLRGTQIYVGGTLIAPSSEFSGAEPFPGTGRTERQNVGVVIPPAAYVTRRLTEGLVVGLGVHVPFGLRTEWENPSSFSGRFLSTRAELTGYSLNPTVGYKVADRLSVGAGLDLRFAKVRLERRVPTFDPFTNVVVDVAALDLESDTATDLGFNLGVLGKPTESLSFGLSYRHKVATDFTGSASFTPVPTGNAQLDALAARSLPGSLPVETAIEFPAILSAGVAYTWNDWIFEGDVNWYQWSTFDRVSLRFEGRPDLNTVIEEEYDNSFQFRVGAERRLNDAWLVRGGYFFDPSPAPAASVSPLLPDADRHGFALGGTWTNGALRLDGAAWYIRSPDRSTEGVNRDGFEGVYSNSAFTFGLFLGYAF